MVLGTDIIKLGEEEIIKCDGELGNSNLSFICWYCELDKLFYFFSISFYIGKRGLKVIILVKNESLRNSRIFVWF